MSKWDAHASSARAKARAMGVAQTRRPMTVCCKAARLVLVVATAVLSTWSADSVAHHCGCGCCGCGSRQDAVGHMCRRVKLAQPVARREATAKGALCLLAWPLPSCFSVGPNSQRAQGACLHSPAC